MSTEPKTGLTYWAAGILQPDLLFNALLQRFGAVGGQPTVKDKDLSTPPGSPAAGDTYIVGPAATGAWATHENDVAYYDSTWYFFDPAEGWRVDVVDEDLQYRYSGSAWVVYEPPALGANQFYARSSAGAAALKTISDDALAFVAAANNAAMRTALGAAKTADVQIFTVSGTWTKPAGALSVRVMLLGGGGGGGSGRKGLAGSIRCGGGGGGGGGHSAMTFDASLLGSSETVTIGAGGTGGAAQATDSTNGNPGGPGILTSFGAHLRTSTSGNGSGGTATTGTGGNGGPGSEAAGNTGASASTTGLVGNNAAGTLFSGGGGGSGGGITSGNAASAGGNSNGIVLAGGTGTATGGAIDNPGVTGTSYAASKVATGGSGGGSSITTNGGAGGNGGTYGGGGGGGGASVDATGSSGAGGNGADGIAVIVSYF